MSIASRKTRYQQIAWHVERHQVREWLAIDDLHSGYQTWPEELQHQLVMPHGERGLGCEIVQAELHQKLHNLFGSHTGSSANER